MSKEENPKQDPPSEWDGFDETDIESCRTRAQRETFRFKPQKEWTSSQHYGDWWEDPWPSGMKHGLFEWFQWRHSDAKTAEEKQAVIDDYVETRTHQLFSNTNSAFGDYDDWTHFDKDSVRPEFVVSYPDNEVFVRVDDAYYQVHWKPGKVRFSFVGDLPERDVFHAYPRWTTGSAIIRARIRTPSELEAALRSRFLHEEMPDWVVRHFPSLEKDERNPPDYVAAGYIGGWYLKYVVFHPSPEDFKGQMAQILGDWLTGGKLLCRPNGYYDFSKINKDWLAERRKRKE